MGGTGEVVSDRERSLNGYHLLDDELRQRERIGWKRIDPRLLSCQLKGKAVRLLRPIETRYIGTLLVRCSREELCARAAKKSRVSFRDKLNRDLQQFAQR